ncbi:Glycosyl transferase [Olea europaea subsp. europaea]|uniref:Glycosyl transferase n=1 Tax=Olea europaea subsp. europaea TaxID=158383 RepID=A0A8S0VNR4_OLEEU|nr:Glycosyl transferase [Olea europaea subsp. europaea]
MAMNNKPKKPLFNLKSNLAITLFFIVVFTIPALLLLHTPSTLICTTFSSNNKAWSGDLRDAEFAWNHLKFFNEEPSLRSLKIAVFSRKWPISTTPGSGPWKQRYKDLGPQSIVLGSMSPSELRAFYNAIDIFVNPTLRPQGLDLTLMEAMMSGKPVMASRFPSIKGTIVVKDEFGFMFSPNVESLSQALELVVSEGSNRLLQRGKACKEYAASVFTARKMALAYER